MLVVPRRNGNSTDAWVVIDDDAFEYGFKLEEQYENRRLCFNRNAS